MASAPVTRATLLLRIRDADDSVAWEEFLELYGPFVYGWFRKRGLQDADAADLTQDVLQGVAFGANRLDYDPERGTFRSWLFRIARNKLHDYLGRQRKTPLATADSSVQQLIQMTPAAEDPDLWEEDFQRTLFQLASERVCQQVDGSSWEAFRLTAVEGRSGGDVADLLNMTVGAVYVAKSRVLARIKRQIEMIQGDD